VKYDYLISYNYKNEIKEGSGCLMIPKIFKINSIEALKEIRRYIMEREENKFTELVILNYQIIRKHWR